jgi:hypothetical protein
MPEGVDENEQVKLLFVLELWIYSVDDHTRLLRAKIQK